MSAADADQKTKRAARGCRSVLFRDCGPREYHPLGKIPRVAGLCYLEIVDWAGRQQRMDKPGSISSSLKPIFERVGFSSTGFLDSMMRLAEQETFFKATERLGQPERPFAKTPNLTSSRV